jgi:hypothetical protein
MSLAVWAGPYTEWGINGFLVDTGITEPNEPNVPYDPNDPNTYSKTDPNEEDPAINPIFRSWADGVVSYVPSPQTIQLWWKDPTLALGPATGEFIDIVSLGDLTQEQINLGTSPGQITLSFSTPIFNGKGYDFAVFENGFIFQDEMGVGTEIGEIFAEFGYVEVSSDGIHFARFPSVSLTEDPNEAHSYFSQDMTNLYNLTGKHPNAYGICSGTPFDLRELENHPDILSGTINLSSIQYVRIVDIPGSGDYSDQAVEHIDPNTYDHGGTGPTWEYYTDNHPIYDAWLTFGSGGFDLEAIGVLHEQQYEADINLDGIVDLRDFAIFSASFMTHFGEDEWLARCDMARPENHIIDVADLSILASQWLQKELWYPQE